MDGTKTREALKAFLDYVADKGLMEKATAQARKAAVSKIFSILEDDEANDVTAIDIDHVVDRFRRLHGKDYTPTSLSTYRSRVKSSVEDFESYLSNPLAFRPSIGPRAKPMPKTPKEPVHAGVGRTPEPQQSDQTRTASVRLPTDNLLPIQIRSDLTVYVQGIPFDLTEAEARKIANVITAMAG